VGADRDRLLVDEQAIAAGRGIDLFAVAGDVQDPE
jgi:hypothetical protein